MEIITRTFIKIDGEEKEITREELDAKVSDAEKQIADLQKFLSSANIFLYGKDKKEKKIYPKHSSKEKTDVVYNLLCANPDLNTVQKISGKVGFSDTSVQASLVSLRVEGLVARIEEGTHYKYFIVPEKQEVMRNE